MVKELCKCLRVKVGVPVATQLRRHLQVRNSLYECHAHNQKVETELGYFLWVDWVGRSDSNLLFCVFKNFLKNLLSSCPEEEVPL